MTRSGTLATLAHDRSRTFPALTRDEVTRAHHHNDGYENVVNAGPKPRLGCFGVTVGPQEDSMSRCSVVALNVAAHSEGRARSALLSLRRCAPTDVPPVALGMPKTSPSRSLRLF